MKSPRTLSAIFLGVVFSACAAYWFTIGRRPLLEEVEPEAVGEPT